MLLFTLHLACSSIDDPLICPLPTQVLLSSDKETVYDSLPVAVDKVYVFSNKISDVETEELNDMVKELHGSIGVILVDV